MASDLRAVNRRASVVGLAIVAALFGVGMKAGRIAIDQHEAYAEQATASSCAATSCPASRGEIVDRDHDPRRQRPRPQRDPLNPRFIRAQGQEDAVVTALLQLSPDEDPAYLADKLTKDKAYRQLRMTLSDAQATTLDELGLPGVRPQAGQRAACSTPAACSPRTCSAASTITAAAPAGMRSSAWTSSCGAATP